MSEGTADRDAAASSRSASMPGVYANQTAKAVRLEAYFRGEFAVWSRLEQVQARYRDRYPHLMMPPIGAQGEAIGLKPYHLRSANGDRAIGVAINQVCFVSFAYPGHEKFIGEGAAILSDVLQLLGIDRLERVIYRYENELGIPRLPSGVTPVHEVLRVELPADGPEAGAFHEIDLRYTRAWPRGRMHARIAVDRVGTPYGELAGDVLRFTIAAEVAPAGGSGEIEQLAEVAHEKAIAYFNHLATPDFLAYLRGDEETST